jgi:hypothetical protein
MIKSHPEWKAKLSRAVFSSEGIRQALDQRARLIGMGENDIR